MIRQNHYKQTIEYILFSHYEEGITEIPFERRNLTQAADTLNISPPKNLGDVPHKYRYQTDFPSSINDTAPEGYSWIIRPDGRARYRSVVVVDPQIVPSPLLAETKIPDATPGIVAMYAFNAKQALLANCATTA